jgi:hypothetical protein
VANVQTAPTVKEANSLKLEHLAILTKDSTTVNPALEEEEKASVAEEEEETGALSLTKPSLQKKEKRLRKLLKPLKLLLLKPLLKLLLKKRSKRKKKRARHLTNTWTPSRKSASLYLHLVKLEKDKKFPLNGLLTLLSRKPTKMKKRRLKRRRLKLRNLPSKLSLLIKLFTSSPLLRKDHSVEEEEEEAAAVEEEEALKAHQEKEERELKAHQEAHLEEEEDAVDVEAQLLAFVLLAWLKRTSLPWKLKFR